MTPPPGPLATQGFDTIVAIATAVVPAQGSVSIVRLSGEQALEIGQRLWQGRGKWHSHRVRHGFLQDEQGQVLDEVLLIWMAAPRSYTREDVVEFHCHGGVMVVQSVLQACVRAGARLAQPGEFTLRAFLNGRIDLTQAEGISDVVQAQSQQAAQVALGSLQGTLATRIRQLRGQCLSLLAEIEARLDFADELPPLDEGAIAQALETVASDVATLLATADQGTLLRQGLKVAIVGRPNVGKSSLLNAWSGQDRAIVTPLPGTTRDVVESLLVVAGIPVQILDTAGIRETEDVVEAIGIERSRQMAQAADLVLLVIDAPTGWTAEDETIRQLLGDRPTLLVVNKMDLIGDRPHGLPFPPAQQVFTNFRPDQPDLWFKSIQNLEAALLNQIGSANLQAQDLAIAINQRQKAALVRAQVAIAQTQQTIRQSLPLDFWTIDLRDASQALGEITGEDLTESVLERIFSQFCIGK